MFTSLCLLPPLPSPSDLCFMFLQLAVGLSPNFISITPEGGGREGREKRWLLDQHKAVVDREAHSKYPPVEVLCCFHSSRHIQQKSCLHCVCGNSKNGSIYASHRQGVLVGGKGGNSSPPPPPESGFAPLRWAMINSKKSKSHNTGQSQYKACPPQF